MICEECKKEGKTSRVFDSKAFRTNDKEVTYWDEAGNYHIHDGNVTTQKFTCSNGHKWKTITTAGCCAVGCDFKKKV